MTTTKFVLPAFQPGYRAALIFGLSFLLGMAFFMSNLPQASAAAPGQAVAVDLGVTMTGPDLARPGTKFTYEITVVNNGPDAAANPLLTDTLPSKTTFVSLTQTSGPTFNCATPVVDGTGTVSCTIASLPSGTSSTFTLVLRSHPGAKISITNEAHIREDASQTDTDAFNDDSAVDIILLDASANVSITKVKSGGANLISGANNTYNLTVTNSGPSDSSRVQLLDTLPAGTTFVSLSQTSGPAFTCTTPAVGAAGTVDCVIPLLKADNPTATFDLVVLLDGSTLTGTVITNTATANSTPDSPNQPTPDPNEANNTAETSGSALSQALISVVKNGPATALPAANLIYTISVNNTGSVDAQNVALTDAIPANATFISLSQDSGPAFACITPAVGGTGPVICTLATMPGGSSAGLTLVVAVDPAFSGNIINTATVVADNNTFGASNVSTVVTVISATPLPPLPNPPSQFTVLAADLVGQLRVTPDRTAAIDPATVISYSLTIKNIGPGKATSAVVRFPIDPNLEIGYASFDNPGMWVSQIVTGVDDPYLLIGLPNLDSGQILTGSLVFHPMAAAADGTKVFTRFTLTWTDDENSNKQAGSNAVRFGLSLTTGSTLDLNGGEVQLFDPSNSSLANGQTITITGDFFAPNEMVTFWYTDKDSHSQEIGSKVADANGRVSFDFTPSGLVVGDSYVVAAYGNRSAIYGSSVIAIAA